MLYAEVVGDTGQVKSCSTQLKWRITNALPSTLVYDWDLADNCLALYLRDAVYKVEDVENNTFLPLVSTGAQHATTTLLAVLFPMKTLSGHLMRHYFTFLNIISLFLFSLRKFKAELHKGRIRKRIS
jgi:hypothetical protein